MRDHDEGRIKSTTPWLPTDDWKHCTYLYCNSYEIQYFSIQISKIIENLSSCRHYDRFWKKTRRFWNVTFGDKIRAFRQQSCRSQKKSFGYIATLKVLLRQNLQKPEKFIEDEREQLKSIQGIVVYKGENIRRNLNLPLCTG